MRSRQRKRVSPDGIGRLTEGQLENRLTMLERMIQVAGPKDLPYLNATYQRVMERLVEIDLSRAASGETRGA